MAADEAMPNSTHTQNKNHIPGWNIHVGEKPKVSQYTYFYWMKNPKVDPGAQSALRFGGGNFHEISFDDVIVLIQPWYNFFANGHI